MWLVIGTIIGCLSGFLAAKYNYWFLGIVIVWFLLAYTFRSDI